MKKMTALILTALFIFSAVCACTVVRSDSLSVPLYGGRVASADTSAKVYPNQYIAMRFNASTSFNGIDIKVATSTALTAKLFVWKNNITETVRQEPVAEQRLQAVANTPVKFSFDKAEKGEYVIAVEPETISTFKTANARNTSVRLYINGYAFKNRQAYFTLDYMYTPSEELGALSLNSDTLYSVSYPQKELPEDSPVFTKDVYADTFAATDGLGRTLPLNEETGDVRERFVGIFYWSWHTLHTKPNTEIKNIEHILADNGNYNWTTNKGKYHYWGEPIFGYYKSTDDWVIMKHAQLLANAGVDVIFFDCTNGVETWKDEYEHIFKIFEQALKEGVNVPKIAFMLPFGVQEIANTQLNMLYYDLYIKGRYQDLWFYWDGKPLILCNPSNIYSHIPDEIPISDFFTFRTCEANYVDGGVNKWNWLSIHPQAENYDTDGNLEQMSVSIAQNALPNYRETRSWSYISLKDSLNRAYTYEKGHSENEERDMLYGLNFAEQWEYAIEKDPEFIFVTGWNEWTAINFSNNDSQPLFADLFSPLASRDCEPSTGILKDHYYYQLVSYIRKFKGTRPQRKASDAKTVDIYGSLSQWDDVGPDFYAYTGDVFDRDSQGYAGTYYTDTSGRNDIALAKVAHDSEYLYFYVQTVDALTPYTDPSWMRLYLDIGNSETSWEGFEYVINRLSPTESKAYVERSLGGWDWQTVTEADYSVNGNVLQIKIPRSALGITESSFTVNFKWADNAQRDGDIMDFYVSGDVAPEGRFTYSYIVE